LEMPGKVDSENDMLEMHHMEVSFIYSSLQCCNENEDCEEGVAEWLAVKHQKIRKLIRMTQLSMKGWGVSVDRPRKRSLMELFPHWTRDAIMWDWGGTILMLWELGFLCSLCSLLGACV
jgi:hypothetical protein